MTAQAVIPEIEGLPAGERAKVFAYLEGVVATRDRPGQSDFEALRQRYQSPEFAAELTALLHEAKRRALAGPAEHEARN